MMLSGIPIQDVLFTVFQSIFQVFLLCLAGFVLSFKGIVDKPTSKVLNHINIALFTPALLFSKVAFFLTPAKLLQLWVIPIFFTVVTVLSAVIAHWLARAFRLKRSQVNFATAASMFMNSNSIPIALMQSLASTVPLLRWGPDDTIDAMFSRSLTYLVVFSTLGMILRWSYGVRLISQADEPELATPAPTTYRDADDTEGHPALPHIAVDPPHTAKLIDCDTGTDSEPNDRMLWRTRPVRSRPLRPRLTPISWYLAHQHLRRHSHLPAVPTSLGDQSETEDSDELEATECDGDSEDTIALRSEPIDTGSATEAEDSPSAPLPCSSSSEPNGRSTPRWDRKHSSSSLTLFTWPLTAITSLPPPLTASLFALFCALIPPVQRLLKSKVMSPFDGALDVAGGCSIPITLVVLGGWFWDEETEPKGKGGHAADGEVKGGSDGQGDAKSKGKGVEECRSPGIGTGAVPTLLDDQHSPTTENTSPRPGHYVAPPSRDSSAASLSSMIGAFGDVLMASIHPRGGSGRTKRRMWGNMGANESDLEPGLLATHTGTRDENAGNGIGPPSRPRSQTGHVNGRAGLSPVPPSSTSQPPAPKLPRARRMNPPGETLTIFVALLSRMVIVPIIVTPMIVLVSRLGWGGAVFEDPVFIVSSLLLVSSPPALTLAQISQRSKTTPGAAAETNTKADSFSPFERLFSRTVFWGYCALTPPVTIVSVMVGLLLIGA